MNGRAEPSIEVEIVVSAPPQRVWDVVSDVARMGEWSPECIKVFIWGRRGVRQGARMTGINRRKLVFWPTTSIIHRYDEGRAIGWRTLDSGARWIYELEPDESGAVTRVVERRELPKGHSRLAKIFGAVFLGGLSEHGDELRDGMRMTLERIKTTAETR